MFSLAQLIEVYLTVSGFMYFAFWKILHAFVFVFEKSFRNTWFQTVCKGNQQTALVNKELK